MRDVSSEAAMGSILFEDRDIAKQFFSQKEIAMLSTRLKLQELLPNESKLSMLNDGGFEGIVEYLNKIHEIIEDTNQEEVRSLVQKSFYDMIGR